MVLFFSQRPFLIFELSQISDSGLESGLIADLEFLELLDYLILSYYLLLLFSFEQQNISINHIVQLIIEFLDSISYLLVLSYQFVHIELIQYVFFIVGTVLFCNICVLVWCLLLFLIDFRSWMERPILRSHTIASVNSAWIFSVFHNWLCSFSGFLSWPWNADSIKSSFGWHILLLFRTMYDWRGFLFLMILEIFFVLCVFEILIGILIDAFLKFLIFQCGSVSFDFLLGFLCVGF